MFTSTTVTSSTRALAIKQELDHHPMHADLLCYVADSLYQNALVQQWSDQRLLLQRADDFYHRALALRPHWVHTLKRLADTYCVLSIQARSTVAAMEMRMRAGARYQEAMLLQMYDKVVHEDMDATKQRWLITIPRQDLAAVMYSTKQLTDITDINVNFFPNISTPTLRSVFGRVTTLKKLVIEKSNTLTDEVLTLISARNPQLELLRIPQCLKVTGVSMASLAQHNKQALSVIDISYADSIDDDRLSKVFLHCSKLTQVVMNHCERISSISFRDIGRVCRQLRHLDISHSAEISAAGLLDMAANCTNLTHLNVSGCSGVDDSLLQVLGRTSVSLKELYVNKTLLITTAGISGLASLKTFPLQRLEFHGCFRVDLLAVEHVGTSLGDLRHINMRECPKVVSISFELLIETQTDHLLSIDCGLIPNIADSTARRIAQYCPNMTHLNLDYCEAITHTAFVMVGLECQSLKTLSIEGCGGSVGDLTLKSFLTTSLTHLNLSGCSQITDWGVVPLIRTNTNLTYLNLYEMRNGTNRIPATMAAYTLEMIHFVISSSDWITDESIGDMLHKCPMVRKVEVTNCCRVTPALRRMVQMHMPWLSLV